MIPHGVMAVGRKIHRQFALVPSPPVDYPSKRYLLAGPPPNLDWPTWKNLQALNGVMALRMVEREEVRRARRWAEAARRLPL